MKDETRGFVESVVEAESLRGTALRDAMALCVQSLSAAMQEVYAQHAKYEAMVDAGDRETAASLGELVQARKVLEYELPKLRSSADRIRRALRKYEERCTDLCEPMLAEADATREGG